MYFMTNYENLYIIAKNKKVITKLLKRTAML